MLNDLKPSARVRDLIAKWEGLRAEAYLCPAGVWTIGYGHTGPDVEKGMRISQSAALLLLEADIQPAASAVRSAARVKLNQNQFDALVSFVFNLGAGALGSSTLLGKLNRGDFEGAADEFPKWNKAGQPKKVLPGLVTRRAAERALFRRAPGLEDDA